MTDNKDFNGMLLQDAQWCNKLGFNDIDGLNKVIIEDKSIQLINLCEARHENRCCEIARHIVERGSKVILLAGPSSSGKTSTSLRIALQCKVQGLNPRTIELDNYFVDREQTPRLPDGQYDYECLEAMDLKLLNEHINELLAGREVELPRYDFKNGVKYFEGNRMRLEENDILIMEGIHALDPNMTSGIPDKLKFLIYISDVSSISEFAEGFNTSDNRLLRRMARDVSSRNISPEETILRWPTVRAGEEKYIYPFQEKADVVFNSTVQYELPLLKHFVRIPLIRIPENSAAYPEARRLLKCLDLIEQLPLKALLAIPVTSIMREFTGYQILSRDLL